MLVLVKHFIKNKKLQELFSQQKFHLPKMEVLNQLFTAIPGVGKLPQKSLYR